ncbi:MAG TPA: hypothetical protein VEG64_08590 [Candidatus Sulfotelmatobacter sp.]|nr:hypothetical protein [Candidatus Sulfotelmatobacter sp.]
MNSKHVLRRYAKAFAEVLAFEMISSAFVEACAMALWFVVSISIQFVMAIIAGLLGLA